MIIKKTFFTLLVLILLSTNSYSAGTDSTAKVKSDYDKAVTIIKAAKKYEKKGKLEKAKKDMKKHKLYLLNQTRKNLFRQKP